MLERKPGLYEERYSSQLEARVALWKIIVKKDWTRYPEIPFGNENLSSKSWKVLDGLFHSDDEEYRISILKNELPDAAACIAMANEMAVVFNAEDRIAILKRYLENRLQIKPEDTVLLLSIDNSQDFPEVIKFFFDHELCTTEHILSFLNRYKHHADFFKICIMHPKFPATREAYHSYENNKVEHLYTSSVNRLKYIILNIESILTYRPQLIISEDLNNMNNSLYFMQDRAGGYVDFHEELIKKAFFLVWSHPEASYLSDYNFSFKPNRPVFHVAAQYGYSDLFKLIYFNDDTTEEARKSAIQIAIRYKKWDLIENVSCALLVSHYQKIILPFYMEMICNPFPKEVLMLIFNDLIMKAQMDCLETAINNKCLPEIYTNKNDFELALFQKKVVTPDSLINRALIGIDNYFFEHPQPKPGSTGKVRGEMVIAILKNKLISPDCKFIAIYAVLNEETYYESRVKRHLLTSIGCYLNMINTGAEYYAGKLNLDLTKICNNFIKFIHCGLITKAKSIDEKQLLKYITNNAEFDNSKKI